MLIFPNSYLLTSYWNTVNQCSDMQGFLTVT